MTKERAIELLKFKYQHSWSDEEIDEAYSMAFEALSASVLIPKFDIDKGEKIKRELRIYLDWLDGRKDYAPRGEYTIRDMIVWLEKQGEKEQLYIRFGEIPTDEKSKIYQGEIEVGTENGVSVYPAFKTDEGDIVLGLSLPITKTTLYTQQHLIEYDDRLCYLVKGDYVGKDTDGQPLINNISIIEKIDSYRVKEENQGEKLTLEKVTKAFLEALSKTPYNNMPIVQAQASAKQLLTFLTDTKSYKPDNEIEPKFHEGDWITHNTANFVFKVINVGSNGYEVVNRENYKKTISFDNEDKYHLWTIQDARDGDVLVNGNEIIVIFKENNFNQKDLSGCMFVHCSLCNKKGYWYTIGGINPSDYVPATKEQRNALMKVMTDAGYTFDFEKKELKKIEQKPAEWSEEDEKTLKNIIGNIESIRNTAVVEQYVDILDKDIEWLKSIKERVLPQPKQERSEEDEKYISSIIKMVEHCSFSSIGGITKAAAVAWLKFPKERVQPKQEWGIEDSMHLTNAILAAEKEWGIESCTSKWLKSLRPQKYAGYNPYKATVESIAKMCDRYENVMWDETEAKYFLCEVSAKCHEAVEYDKKYPQKQWKPSEEQMKALYAARHGNYFDVHTLESLFYDLEQLK